jgi:hypothetical protein
VRGVQSWYVLTQMPEVVPIASGEQPLVQSVGFRLDARVGRALQHCGVFQLVAGECFGPPFYRICLCTNSMIFSVAWAAAGAVGFLVMNACPSPSYSSRSTWPPAFL